MSSFTPISMFWPLFLGALAATALLTPLVMRFARRVGAVDCGGYRRVYQGTMPLLGGLAVALPLVALFVFAAGAGAWTVRFWEWIVRAHPGWLDPLMQMASLRRDFAALAIGGVAILALGIADDTRGLRARYKLLGQILVAALVCYFGSPLERIALPWGEPLVFGPVLGWAVTIFWIVGLINAFNLIDGLDGLAAGIALIAASSLGILMFLSGAEWPALICAVLAGCLLAFLFYNFHPARIFLGDTGSMFLGYILAVSALASSYKSEAAVIVLAPLLALGFPIFETLLSMARRYARGVPVFAGDNLHTHHRLLGRGYSQRQVVLLLYVVAFLLAGAAVLSRLIPSESFWTWVPVALVIGTLGWITWLAGYLRPAVFARAVERRRRNAVRQALARYAALGLGGKNARVQRGEILDLLRKELELRFLDAWFEENQHLIAVSGEKKKMEEGEKIGPGMPAGFDTAEKLRVHSGHGHRLVVHYQFEQVPEEQERRDVAACLAQAFENASLHPPRARIVPLETEKKDTTGTPAKDKEQVR